MRVYLPFAIFSFITVLAFGKPATDPWAISPETGSESRWTKYTETRDEMIPFIWKEMQDKEIMGLLIALIDDQEVVWARGFGYADLAEGTWATESTIYRIGSVSKTLTAASIMQLSTWEGGTLDIENPVTDYLPAFSINTEPLHPGPSPSDPITVETMLTHHSGIPGDLFNGLFTVTPYPGYNDWLLNYLAGTYVAYPTNFVWVYSNSAFHLLGNVGRGGVTH